MAKGYSGGFRGNRLRDRERGEELRFEMEQELRFKAESRRNRLLGEWLAHKFGMTSDETKAYATEVVNSDLDKPGVEDLVAKVMKDIEDKGAGITEEEVRKQIDRLYTVALEQLENDFKTDSL
ncbi:MAG: DUF1476 domain-containing protein [Rhodospirillales bacterium]